MIQASAKYRVTAKLFDVLERELAWRQKLPKNLGKKKWKKISGKKFVE